jgi:dipeptidyl-peptidase III
VKKSLECQKHLTEGHELANAAKHTTRFLQAGLCALTSLHESVDFFTPSEPFGESLRPFHAPSAPFQATKKVGAFPRQAVEPRSLILAGLVLVTAAAAANPARLEGAQPPRSAQVEPAQKPTPQDESLVDRVRQTGFVQLQADSFNGLPSDRKLLAYWLSMAAIAVNPIVYDQNSVYGLREKRLLEQILAHSEGIDPGAFQKISDYTKLFWGNRGNHNAFTSRKFLPELTPAELKAGAERALKNGAHLGTPAKLARELEELEKPIFDPNFESMLTLKNPPNGEDPLQASANNLYQGVSLIDLKDFAEEYPLNSRLVKKNGKLVEQTYRAGTPDGKIPPGLYANELALAIRYLKQAVPYTSDSQKVVVNDLVRYYQSGDPADWRQFNIDWVKDNSDIDFTNGFIEVYKDARGMKGASQAFVTSIDARMNKLMKGFAENAAYFEKRAPWDNQYKLEKPQPPLANAVEALIETGDFDVNTIGENLPNEAEIHDKYGSKSFIFTGSTRALNAARGDKVDQEFCNAEPELERARKYGDLAEDLFTAMHEVIGHGSGKMNPKLTQEPAVYIKEYYSTLEETRADLMALWNFFDPKLVELGAMPSYDVAKAAYDGEARAALVQLREVPTGDTIEEDHRRGTQLIVNYIRDKTGAIQPVLRDGKVYLLVTNYQKMREGVGMLLSELMRIKAEGDYEGAKSLITQYGIHFDKEWRDQVVARYAKLDLPTYWVGINPDLELHKASKSKPDDVTISYPRDIVKQQLRYTAIAGQ